MATLTSAPDSRLDRVELGPYFDSLGIVQASEAVDGIPCLRVSRELLLDVLGFLKSSGYAFLTTLAALHFPERAGAELEVMYQLHDLVRNRRVRIKVAFSAADDWLPSVTGLWTCANWMERQEYDFFGIRFTGHPDLRRILNVDDLPYFPLRKDCELEDATREDKNDAAFGR